MADDKTFAVGEILSAADTNEYLVRGYWKRIGRQIIPSGSPVSSVTFSSIESRFRSFRLHISVNKEAQVRLNNDSGSNYNALTYAMNNSPVDTGLETSIYFNFGFGGPVMQEMTISKIATTEEALIAGAGTGISTPPALGQRIGAYAWINTSSLINRIDVLPNSGTFFGTVALEGMVGA